MRKTDAPARPKRRTWPLWLLASALALLVLSVLLMQRSYRQQLDASMAQLQHSVAAARLHQQRLAAQLRAPQPPGPAALGTATQAVPSEGGQPAPTPHQGQAAALAQRLQRIANELDLLAKEGGTTAASRAEWLDWSRVRAELWSVSRALRQYRPTAPRRSGANATQTPLRDWITRAQSAANQEKPAALAAALSAIQQQLTAQGRVDANAERLARRTARLSAVLRVDGQSPSERQRLEGLARETSAVARRLLRITADSGVDRGTPR